MRYTIKSNLMKYMGRVTEGMRTAIRRGNNLEAEAMLNDFYTLFERDLKIMHQAGNGSRVYNDFRRVSLDLVGSMVSAPVQNQTMTREDK